MDIGIADKIITFIRDNKVSSTEVADCLGKTGAIKGAKPLNKGMHRVGLVQYVYAHSDTNWPIHEQIRFIPEGRVIFVDDINGGRRALFGELVSSFLVIERKAQAIVTEGLMRDIAELLEGRFPIWCGGITPEGCYNTRREENPEVKMIARTNKERYQDAIAVCDDCGVVVIPKDEITDEMYRKLVRIEEQEKVWFHCVRDLGWDTFDTVCLKKYEDK
ncbi:demethylmenaquinone methyltransferase [Slackia equolifaciens]|uniref:Demethylmenaquinone methyltransferase n=1 Tax=Slackia equolifaciens TaxID=498718 RepID=A0A3N0AUI4_9ACTN|nr:RraA family protein [Slackia equolifaciens]RNL38209.1 demethylmenaquinone methyltransferase [Slackia equolifaciens]